jgi:hypothetical protein
MAHDPLIRNAVLQELHDPVVLDGVEETADVRIEDPVHLLHRDPGRQSIQRIVLTSLGSKSVREVLEVELVHAVEHLDGRALNNLVLQRRHAERSLSSIRFRDVHPANGSGSICSALQSSGQGLKVRLQVLSVRLPRLSICACSRISFHPEIRLS